MTDIALTAAKIAPCFPEKAEIFSGIAGVTITPGAAVYMIVASGKLGLADEDASAEASWVWGIALNGGGAGQAIDVLRRGHVYGFTVSGLAYGLICNLSATAGVLTDGNSATNPVARVVPLTDADMTKVLFVDCSIIPAA
jgi:hypothetical protein